MRRSVGSEIQPAPSLTHGERGREGVRSIAGMLVGITFPNRCVILYGAIPTSGNGRLSFSFELRGRLSRTRLLQARLASSFHPVEDAQGRRQRRHHVAFRCVEQARNLARAANRRNRAPVHDDHLVGAGEHLFQTVLGQKDDGHAQLEVNLANRVQEVRRRDGVELACGFVEDEARSGAWP